MNGVHRITHNHPSLSISPSLFLLHPCCCIILSPPLFHAHFLILLFTIFSLFSYLHFTHSSSVCLTEQPFQTFSSLLTLLAFSFWTLSRIIVTFQVILFLPPPPYLTLSIWSQRSNFSLHATLFVLRCLLEGEGTFLTNVLLSQGCPFFLFSFSMVQIVMKM